MRCSKHPAYKAILTPRVDCEECIKIWKKKHERLLTWIGNHLNPSDVFEDDKLYQWADESGELYTLDEAGEELMSMAESLEER